MCTLTFVLYCLSEHPDVLAALRQEILTNIGPTRRPTYEDIRQCKYLRAVINGKVLSLLSNTVFFTWLAIETLRLYPPVYAPTSLLR